MNIHVEDKISALTTKDPSKLQVYTDGFDGHSLSAYAYAEGTEAWYADIRQAEPSEETFKVTIGEEIHYLKGTDIVMDSNGNEVLVKDLV